jgi:hypothetical protein
MKKTNDMPGQLTSLDYADPFIDPHREFQKFKLHPMVTALLKTQSLYNTAQRLPRWEVISPYPG